MNEQMQKVKKVEVDILKEFVRVCKEMDLTYYALYGTVLGAVRHKGFIPWDDDIDVGMPREDYEKFLKHGQKFLRENYFLQSYKSEEGFLNPFAKVRRSDTTFIETASKDQDINQGIYIDIFPIDGYPEGAWDQFKFKWDRIVYDNYIYNQGDVSKESGKNKFICQINRIFVKLTPREAVKRKDCLAKRKQIKDSKRIGCLVQDNPDKEVVEKECFGKGCMLPFEDMEICVPENWDLYLEHTYGDYMQFPPEEERVPLHVCEVIDTELSYTHYKKQKR